MSALITTAGHLADQATTLWLAAPVPGDLQNPGTQAPPGSNAVLRLLAWAGWIAFAFCIAGILKGGGLLAWAGIRGRGSDGGGEVTGTAIVGTIIVGAGATILTTLAALL